MLGDEIIETPMAWRSRFFESCAYRPLFKEYFSQGARWTSAPKPQLTDELFEPLYRPPGDGEPMRYLLTESEPVFDAADFIRCGRDIFAMRSNVTNISEIDWLRRHLGDTYRVHTLELRCRTPMHIDSSFMPLAPGKVLVNPDYPRARRRGDDGRFRARRPWRAHSDSGPRVREVEVPRRRLPRALEETADCFRRH